MIDPGAVGTGGGAGQVKDGQTRLSALMSAGLGEKSGAARRIRTADPIITNDVLYQLS